MNWESILNLSNNNSKNNMSTVNMTSDTVWLAVKHFTSVALKYHAILTCYNLLGIQTFMFVNILSNIITILHVT